MSDFDPNSPLTSLHRRAIKDGKVRIDKGEWACVQFQHGEYGVTPDYGTPGLRMFGKPVEWVDG